MADQAEPSTRDPFTTPTVVLTADAVARALAVKQWKMAATARAVRAEVIP